ncbi:cellulose biosynthesis cyclic di-GMP-binding regulatory protein BcsB [Fulvimarina sp. MAC8]|uniref:cellulose biosynthesis cyclic di-GMP-binding regulatory protein BcsB n=1 Tax=Fulvimarina sp. MAC8 TaxID=3162874 RepID=UPI0032EC30DB
MKTVQNFAAALLVCILAAGSPAASQTAPFDMTPERPAESSNESAPAVAPPETLLPEPRANSAPEIAPFPSSPTDNTLQQQNGSTPGLRAPAESTSTQTVPVEPAQGESTTSDTTAAEQASPLPAASSPSPDAGENSRTTEEESSDGFRRYIVPMEDFSLWGEIASRSWSIYLTPEQARSNSSITVAYQNAIVAAPEASRLMILLNGRVVIDEAVASSQGVTPISSTIPPGLLRAGGNVVEFRTSLRHRTDCTISSTFELWTEFDTSQTFLTFEDTDASKFRRIEDIQAIGFNQTGHTRFNLVVSDSDISSATPSLIELAQRLSLLTQMPNQSTSVTTTISTEAQAGTLTVFVGPIATLSEIGAPVPTHIESNVLFVSDGDPTGPNVVLVTGQNWSDVDATIEGISNVRDEPSSQLRNAIAQPSWRVPAAPIFRGKTMTSFADLGIQTREFSGRRFRTDFTIAVPADFYAQAYGEMTILLDAGYTNGVLPGSRLDVYVNGNIATTVPIGGNSGAILQKFPIQVTMQHIQAGVNDMALVANLITSADDACVPGSTASGDSRFVLFDTSQLQFPDFAQISVRPNLSAFRGVGYPYNRSTEPVPLVMTEEGPEAASVAATLMGRIASIAERPIPFTVQRTPFSIDDKDAIIVGPISQTADSVLTQVGIDPAAKNRWVETDSSDVQDETGAAISRWRDDIVQEDWRHPLIALENWLQKEFDVSPSDLRIMPQEQPPYLPSANSSMLVAQGIAPDEHSVWTLVSSPSSSKLADGVDKLTTYNGWSQLGGRVTSYNSSDGSFDRATVGIQELVQSQPVTFSNLRLIAANWLSMHLLAYATLLVITALLLGIATTALTSVLGRR